jgi:hypothetical protein
MGGAGMTHDYKAALEWFKSFSKDWENFASAIPVKDAIESALQTMCKLEALRVPPARMPTEIVYDPINPADTSQNEEHGV